MASTVFRLPWDDIADFNSFKVVYDVEGRLVNEAPLRVGLGKAEQLGSPTDLPVIRIGRRGRVEEPYIPGSSLKGVLRSYVERIAAAIYDQQVVHSPFDTEQVNKEYRERYVCAVCGIFGNTKLASHVIVRDSLPLDSPTLMLKPGIGINRDFGGVQPGALFVEEYISPGVEWSFNMKVINIKIEDEMGGDPRVKLLRLMISSLTNGELQVGGRKSIGAGVISLKGLKVWKKTVEDGELRVSEVKI